MYACVLFYFPLKAGIFPFNEDLIPNQQIIEKKLQRCTFLMKSTKEFFLGGSEEVLSQCNTDRISALM